MSNSVILLRTVIAHVEGDANVLDICVCVQIQQTGCSMHLVRLLTLKIGFSSDVYV